MDGSHLPGMWQSEISHAEKTQSLPETMLSRCTWETKQLGLGRYIKCTAHLGQHTRQAPSGLTCLDLGRRKCTTNLGLCPCGAPENLSSLDLGSARNPRPTWDSALAEHLGAWVMWSWEIHTVDCGKSSVIHPLWALPALLTSSICFCSTPPSPQHNWTSEPKPLTPCVRVGIRPGTEDSCKQRKPK